MKKLVVKLDVNDDSDGSKATQAVSDSGWITSLTMDVKDNKLMVLGDFDPVNVVRTLRNSWRTEIVSVGPAKEYDG
ncbi:hypothetical protein EUGRSUZ_E01525 [Eucalyptus grandis]|uniref:HMA domain-containing protein n=2 Tax=Eucalyptus grandis TaxID=71139 RepID=A0A059C3Z8_EUCGR|nr:hypothetical protein EUGRSUZ_E01525 [Eucalyptus grandis]